MRSGFALKAMVASPPACTAHDKLLVPVMAPGLRHRLKGTSLRPCRRRKDAAGSVCFV